MCLSVCYCMFTIKTARKCRVKTCTSVFTYKTARSCRVKHMPQCLLLYVHIQDCKKSWSKTCASVFAIVCSHTKLQEDQSRADAAGSLPQGPSPHLKLHPHWSSWFHLHRNMMGLVSERNGLKVNVLFGQGFSRHIFKAYLSWPGDVTVDFIHHCLVVHHGLIHNVVHCPVTAPPAQS